MSTQIQIVVNAEQDLRADQKDVSKSRVRQQSTDEVADGKNVTSDSQVREDKPPSFCADEYVFATWKDGVTCHEAKVVSVDEDKVIFA